MSSGPEDDLERAVRARTGAVRRPLFLPVMILLVVGMPLGVSIGWSRLSLGRMEYASLFALFSGVLGAIGVLGHTPAMFPDPATGQYSLFWAPQRSRIRVVCGGLALFLLVAGIGVDLLLRSPGR